jgi:hypothetical protein
VIAKPISINLDAPSRARDGFAVHVVCISDWSGDIVGLARRLVMACPEREAVARASGSPAGCSMSTLGTPISARLRETCCWRFQSMPNSSAAASGVKQSFYAGVRPSTVKF